MLWRRLRGRGIAREGAIQRETMEAVWNSFGLTMLPDAPKG